MASSSTWAPHPSLTAALEAGLTYADWLGDRQPVVSMARISDDAAKQGLGVGRQHRHCDDAAEGLERVVRLPEDYLRLHRALTVEGDSLLYYAGGKQLIDVYSETEETRTVVQAD